MAVSSSLALSLILKPQPLHFFAAHNSFSPLQAPKHTFSPTQSSGRRRSHCLNLPVQITPRTTKSFKLSAVDGNFLISAASTVESTQEVVSAADDGVSNVISSLLLIAFVGLSILTIGVIYIAVTDFLQKREREKFEKEEAAKKKKSGKKGKDRARARARGGPRGFGQKLEDDDEDEAD